MASFQEQRRILRKVEKILHYAEDSKIEEGTPPQRYDNPQLRLRFDRMASKNLEKVFKEYNVFVTYSEVEYPLSDNPKLVMLIKHQDAIGDQ